MGAELNLDGMQSLIDRLHRMSDKATRIENKALREGAKIIQEAASELAPRDPNSSDHFADHIEISGVKNIDGIKTIGVGPSLGDNSKYFRAKFQEFGTSKMRAQPYMGPAAQRTRSAVIEKMKDVIREAIKP